MNAFARRNMRTIEKRRRRCRLHRRLHHSRGGKVVFHLNIFPLPEHKEVTESFPHSHSKSGFLLLGKNRRYQSCARLFLHSQQNSPTTSWKRTRTLGSVKKRRSSECVNINPRSVLCRRRLEGQCVFAASRACA